MDTRLATTTNGGVFLAVCSGAHTRAQELIEAVREDDIERAVDLLKGGFFTTPVSPDFFAEASG